MSYLPLDQCKHGYLYRIHSRNLSHGVYNEKVQGFIGIREKFGNEYLFTEYHWDTGEPFGTVQPTVELEKLPDDIEVREDLEIVDESTDKPVRVSNEKLFSWLEAKIEQYGYDG